MRSITICAEITVLSFEWAVMLITGVKSGFFGGRRFTNEPLAGGLKGGAAHRDHWAGMDLKEVCGPSHSQFGNLLQTVPRPRALFAKGALQSSAVALSWYQGAEPVGESIHSAATSGRQDHGGRSDFDGRARAAKESGASRSRWVFSMLQPPAGMVLLSWQRGARRS